MAEEARQKGQAGFIITTKIGSLLFLWLLDLVEICPFSTIYGINIYYVYVRQYIVGNLNLGSYREVHGYLRYAF